MPSTCLGCGCTCDDIELRRDGNRILEASQACALGRSWFGDGVLPSRVRLGGRDAALDEALDTIAERLIAAKRPLVYLAGDLSCEAQRDGIAIADHARAMLATLTSSTSMASMLAAQELGRAGATLGEIRNRADVIVFWGVDPAVRYPRYGSRYAPEPAGVHVPEGRRSRTVIAVDVGDARGPADADVRLALSTDEEVQALTRLRAIALNLDMPRVSPLSRVVPEADPSNDPHRGQTPHARYAEIAGLLMGGRYVAIVADAEPDEAGPARDGGRAAGLIALSQALNATTRCALSTLRAGGNRTGADACLTSQTGYPASVDFTRGYPRYRPHEIPLALERGHADMVLVLGSADSLPSAVREAIQRVSHAVAGPSASAGPLDQADVAIDTGKAGIHEAGTAIRMDDVPLPLMAVIPGPPAASAIARALRDRVSVRAARSREVVA
jgi:formylmethanofuran dehydrogenase subunit B